MKTLAQLNVYSTSSVTYTDQTLGINQLLSNRYQINGLIDTAKPALENIEKLCSAAGSWLSYDTHEGKWGVVINQSGTSIVSFNDNNIIGSISVSGTGLKDLYNSTKVEFPHRELRDSADFVTVEIPTADRNANESDNVLNISYDIINEPIQAQVLGIIELKQSRVDLIIKFSTDFSYVNLKAGDIISVTDSRFAFSNKAFRIISITEVQDDGGALMMEITALEYDDNVYSLDDLYRYTRTDANGIITLGNIGTPGTPQVTKYQADARPRIIVESTAPSGVVEGMEFWYTTDYSVSPDSSRSYKQLATIMPVGGGVFTSGSTVTLDHDNIDSGNYFIKTRGFNAASVGPYSTPAGFIFTATQVTGAIGPTTVTIDALGAVGTALGAYALLKGVDGLYSKIGNTGSLFDSIFKTFKDVTGVDLVGDAATGALSGIGVAQDGTLITNNATAINIVGDGITMTDNGNGYITINFGAGGSGNGYTGSQGPQGYTGSQGAGYTGSGGGGGGSTSTSTSNLLTVVAKYPNDRTTGLSPISTSTVASDNAPINGSYYLVFNAPVTMYGPLTKGTGVAYLYKSDGTLVDSLSASELTIDKNVVGFPFATRELGTDYYIIVNAGMIKYCDLAANGAFSTPADWNFNTPLRSKPQYSITATNFASTSSTAVIPLISSKTPVAASTAACSSNPIAITYNNVITKGTGTLRIHNMAGTVITSMPVTGATVTGSTITFGNPPGLSAGTQYYITADAGIVKAVAPSAVDCYQFTSGGNNIAISTSYNWTFKTPPVFTLTDMFVSSLPFTGDTGMVKTNRQANVTLNFNKTIRFGTGNIVIHRSNNDVYQTIDVTRPFITGGVNEVLSTNGSGSVIINPTRDFDPGETYWITVDSGAIKDLCGTSWVGIQGEVYRWTVDPGPTATNSGANSSTSTMTLSFDRAITTGTGVVSVKNSVGDTIATVPPTLV